jgi:hypothetical protein
MLAYLLLLLSLLSLSSSGYNSMLFGTMLRLFPSCMQHFRLLYTSVGFHALMYRPDKILLLF